MPGLGASYAIQTRDDDKTDSTHSTLDEQANASIRTTDDDRHSTSVAREAENVENLITFITFGLQININHSNSLLYRISVLYFMTYFVLLSCTTVSAVV